ncbi:uncharacterized protein LOC119278533 [Triticum dicoccoides]|uniref:uncharacterized protein LOC119278533 n=1 Tax=Triticum dicoccoides TaxID=85692 RepID=UPI00189056B1|nr:uncharacterized protein LOC119278533 [Triticum dicoccoides]
MASGDDDLRARRAGNIKLSAREKSLCYRYDQPIDKQCASSSGSDKEQGYNTVVALERVATESKRVEVLLHLVLELAWKEGQLMMELILVGGSSVMTVTVSLDTHSGVLQVSGIVECLRVVYSAYQGGCTDNLCRPQCQRLEVAQAKEDVVAMQMLKVHKFSRMNNSGGRGGKGCHKFFIAKTVLQVSCRGKTSGLLLQ